MIRTFTAALLAAALAVGGCTTTVSTTAPLYPIAPGVQVVTGWDYPVFYSGGAYYRYDNGTWMYSHHHDHGYVHAHSVPTAVTSIHNPGSYVHYQPRTAYGEYHQH
jgi:hypothetical protein